MLFLQYNKEVLEGTAVDSKLNKVKRIAIYARELFDKFKSNRGI